MTVALRVFLVAVLLVVIPPSDMHAQLAESAEQLKAEHQNVLDDLNVKDAEGKPLELDDPRVPGLVLKGWALAGAWAAAWLDAHPKPSGRDLERIFDGFAPAPQGTKSQYGDFLEYTDYSFGGGAVRVGPSTYVVEASYGVDFLTGTFMVVARNRAGHFEALWDIKRLAERHYAQRDEIGRWMYLVRRAYYSGPLAVGKILPVFPAANGHARFLVEAYQGADGGTLLAQLSIWEWDGTEAKPLLAEAYQYLAGDSHAVRFDGRTIRVSTKEELKVLSSCGACPEPRGAWTVLITPGGVRNLGHRLSQPELGWADELISRVNEGKDATDLASVEALTALKGGIREVEAEFQGDQVQPTDEAKFSPGMLDHCQVLRRGQRGEFVVQTDEARLTFRYTLRNGHPWFTSVEVKSPSEVK